MLKAAGCVVLGMDIDSERCLLAEQNGCGATATIAEGFESLVEARTRERGADAVIITAASTSSEPVELAGGVARARAIVVAVGAVGTEIPRKTFYEKELDFRISRSYGPGRYDPEYEEKGHDYPISYVRWTESRNMEAFLHLIADGKINLPSLITHRFPIEQATEAYELITGKKSERFMGVLIRYRDDVDERRRIDLIAEPTSKIKEPVRVGVLGAGLFANQVLLPAMQKAGGIEFAGVCTATGGTGKHAASRFGFRYCTTDEDEIFGDTSVNTVLIATRHHLHSRQVVAALRAGKHVFCEKPLCLTNEELTEVAQAKSATPDQLIMVGYNRRFAPMSVDLKRFLAETRGPVAINYRINAGAIPAGHWTQDPAQGGGRILGEVCHFVDFLIFLTGCVPQTVFASALPAPGNPPESVAVNLTLEDGSIGTVSYIAEGDKAFGKERIEVFGGGRVAVLDNFRTLELVKGGHRTTNKSALRQDKGHVGEWQAFSKAIREGGSSPIPLREIFGGMQATIAITESLRTGAPVAIDYDFFAALAT
jgi:predicted dehydrogenase